MAHNIDKTPPPVLYLSQQELDVLEAAAFVQFGELLNVEIGRGKPEIQKQVTATQAAFISTLRDQGLTYLDTIIIHNGAPQQIEIDGKHGTIQYKRKLRFH
jgi:hypothetical protein